MEPNTSDLNSVLEDLLAEIDANEVAVVASLKKVGEVNAILGTQAAQRSKEMKKINDRISYQRLMPGIVLDIGNMLAEFTSRLSNELPLLGSLQERFLASWERGMKMTRMLAMKDSPIVQKTYNRLQSAHSTATDLRKQFEVFKGQVDGVLSAEVISSVGAHSVETTKLQAVQQVEQLIHVARHGEERLRQMEREMAKYLEN